jgi:hypothetical protein
LIDTKNKKTMEEKGRLKEYKNIGKLDPEVKQLFNNSTYFFASD